MVMNYNYRKSTDTFFLDNYIGMSYNGYANTIIKYIEERQLLDEELWNRFIEQFTFNSDDEDCGWRGEYWGKMMRGGCFVYRYTKSDKLFACLTEAIKGMLDARRPEGRFSTYSLGMEFNGWDMWSRKYILLGMQYYLEICRDSQLREEIINAMKLHADYIIERIGRPEDGKIQITDTSDLWEGLNSSSILEPMVRLYIITNDSKYLDFASYIIDNGGISSGNIFELAYEGKLYPYQYPVVKAYEMMSCFEGLIEYYRVTGIEKWKTAFINFIRLVAESDITIIGCSGCTHEMFDNSYARQANTIYDGVVQETCVTVTWLKTCLQALCLTGDAVIADMMETSFYNAMLGSVNSEGCTNNEGFPFDSYSPLVYGKRARAVGGHKIMRDGSSYGCCACIGSAGLGVGVLSSVMTTKNGFVFNQYFDGEATLVSPNGNEVRFVIGTKYPFEESIKIKIFSEVTESFEIKLRIPSWCQSGSILVDGEEQKFENGYVSIMKSWNMGDVVDITLDMPIRIINAPEYGKDSQTKNHIALLKGPIVLARDERFSDGIHTPCSPQTDDNGYVIYKKSDNADFYCNVEYTITNNDGSSFSVVDYCSAGKDWKSNIEAWLPTK